MLVCMVEEIVSRIRDAESILIFGPGEAKGELKAHLEKDKLDGRGRYRTIRQDDRPADRGQGP